MDRVVANETNYYNYYGSDAFALKIKLFHGKIQIKSNAE
jgi:hypothetical protein